jgi:hypothetical protein
MLASYIGSSKLLAQQRVALGSTHPSIQSGTATEVAHLKANFRDAAPDRDDVTKLMLHMGSHLDPGVFSDIQKSSLIEAATARLSVTVSANGMTVLQSDLHAGQKLQEHLWSYRYYSPGQWDDWFSTLPLKEKMKLMSRIWLLWGLAFPSGQTFRIGLATLFAAESRIISPEDAFVEVENFQKEFRIIRGVRPTKGTLKEFPPDPATYQMMYPEFLTSFVASRANEKIIEEWAVKEHIPIRNTNARLTGKTSAAKAGRVSGAARSGVDDRAMGDLLNFVLDRSKSPSTSPPPERRTPGTSSLTPPGGDAPTPPTGLPVFRFADGGVVPGGASSGVDKTAEQVAPHVVDPSSPFPEVEAVSGPEGKKKRRKELDHVDDILAQYYNAAAADNLLRKKPSSSKKSRKKVAAEGSEEESDQQEEDDDELSSVDEAPHKGKAAPKAASKAASKAAGKAKAALKPGKAPPTIAKKPAGVASKASAEFPKIAKEGSVYWGGGRVYVYKGKIPAVRAYARVGDRKDRRFGFKDKASLTEAWRSACQVIVDDDREVP